MITAKHCSAFNRASRENRHNKPGTMYGEKDEGIDVERKEVCVCACVRGVGGGGQMRKVFAR